MLTVSGGVIAKTVNSFKANVSEKLVRHIQRL